MRSSVAIVLERRATSSRREMKPSRCAETALHMQAPMLVVDVWTLVLPSLFRMSAGRPDERSVIATNDLRVPLA
jgi:hypothetical protein